MVHSGGHKIRPGLFGILVFRRFSRICGIADESPTLRRTRDDPDHQRFEKRLQNPALAGTVMARLREPVSAA